MYSKSIESSNTATASSIIVGPMRYSPTQSDLDGSVFWAKNDAVIYAAKFKKMNEGGNLQ